LYALSMGVTLSSEAGAKKISVDDDDVERYVEEVARRNNLSKDGFEKALLQQKRSLDDYRQFVRSEITKSKLAGSLAQSGASVSDEEVDAYIKDHGNLGASGNKVKLAQILISTASRSDTEAHAVAEKVRDRLIAGESFATLAREISDGSEGRENGGILGIVAEKDLQSDIFDAVLALKPGEASKVVKTPAGFHIFEVLERYAPESSSTSSDEKLREEVRRALSQHKLDAKMSAYFTADLLKAHTVDRKF
ncbi:MAG: peptidylprolyl isomerase, partial [Oligoflexia bacterium]|nr:peptidylprolyl isomerase [Oligoflexia bacterium]